MLGEAAMEIEIGRLLTMRAAWLLDQGELARKEISMAKVEVADALHKAADTAHPAARRARLFQGHALEWMYRYARQARLVDGASRGAQDGADATSSAAGHGLLLTGAPGDG